MSTPSTAPDSTSPSHADREAPARAAAPEREHASAEPLAAGAFHLLRDVEVEITLEIGRRRLRIADVLKLGEGQTLELSKAAGEPLDIFVNGQLLGRGEAIVLGDRYGVRITEIASPSSGNRS